MTCSPRLTSPASPENLATFGNQIGHRPKDDTHFSALESPRSHQAMSYNRPRTGSLPARGRGSANGARPGRRRSRPLEVNMAGRVRANSAGPRLPFHSYEGSERARWDEEHLVDRAEPHYGAHRTDESGRPGAGEKAETRPGPGWLRPAPESSRIGPMSSGRLHLRTGPLGHFCVSAHQRLARPRDPDQLAAGACPGTGLSR